MKKKTLISAALLSTLILGGVLQANAAVSDVETKGKIQLVDGKGDDGPKDPGDKTDPTNPEDPDPIIPDEDGGKTEGALRLVQVPPLDFGDNNMISTSKTTYYAKYRPVQLVSEPTKDIERASFIQIEDSRGGGKGWKVTLANDGIFTTEDEKSEMKANLYIRDLNIRSNSGITDANQIPELINTEATSMDLAQYTKISSETASAVTIITADANKKAGFGSWSVRIGSTGSKINQEVNNGSTAKETEERNPAIALEVLPGMKDSTQNYMTKLIWTIDDTL